MIFDRAVKIYDQLPELLQKQIKQARIFHLPVYSREMVEACPTDDHRDYVADDFALPYPVVAIEDKQSCVLLWDKVENARGAHHTRGFAEIIPVDDQKLDDDRAWRDDESGEYRENYKELVASASIPKGSTMIIYGEITDVALEKGADGKYLWQMATAIPSQVVAQVGDDVRGPMPAAAVGEGCENAVLRNIKTAYEELIYCNKPDRFIVEKRSKKKTTKHTRKGGIARSFERPYYTLLTAVEARKVMHLPEPSPKKKGGRIVLERRSHMRVAHTRTYRAEKYGDNVGTTVTIPATHVKAFWNGAYDSTVGRHVYKVLVNKSM